MLRLIVLQMLDDGPMSRELDTIMPGLASGRPGPPLHSAMEDCIGLQPEQARADLVVQFERGAPPFVVLCGNKPAIEFKFRGARRLERPSKRVEVIGDDREFTGLAVSGKLTL